MTRRDWLQVMAGVLLTPAAGSEHTTEARVDDLTALSMADLVERIERRALSPIDVAEAYLARIGQLNPDLNALVTVSPERARADAWRASRALPPLPQTAATPSPLLLGAPIAHKDLFDTAGIRTTAGSRLYESRVPARDAWLVARLARAGAVMLGKTNTHELGGGVTTINPFSGTTRNPIDRARIAGGSSGGSAAAVVARLCVAATGSDTGGSVRIPAALCGCVGFKPTFGRLSTAGLLGSCPTFDHVGFLTRTARDAELMFAAALGNPAPGKPSGLPGARIGIARAFFFDRLHPDVARAIETTVERLRRMGATVEDVTLPVDDTTMSRVFDPIVGSEIWSALGAAWRQRPDAFSSAFADFFKTPPPTGDEVRASHRALSGFRQSVDRVFDRVPIVLTPTVPVTAPPIGGPIDGALILRNTWPFNAAGTPTISLPCGVDSAGLPVGLQLAARRQQDWLLLKVAQSLET
jgi:aspartyl-tRNA(Asn)/glutamyl-tRNA(Gln) amidotransferase subunit A